MKPKAALIGAECAVEADSEPAVDVHLSAVVLPRHAENDLPLGLADPLDDLVFSVLRVLSKHGPERLRDFCYGLMKFEFRGVALNDLADNALRLIKIISIGKILFV